VARRWTADETKQIQAAARADWEAGNVRRDFYAKQVERNISDSEIERTLKSKSTLICRYTDYGQPRYGFWHPHVRVVIAWLPAEEGFTSQLKSCFRRTDGDNYLSELEDFEPVRWTG